MEMSLGSFGDLRLDKRGCDPRTGGPAQDDLLAPFGRRPREASCGLGRFFANPKVTVVERVEGWADRTSEASAGRHVLAIQDTSEVTFPTTAQRRCGLGPVGNGNAYGVLVHAMIAVDAASGSCLGLVNGDVWTRAGMNPTPHCQRPLAERESARCVNTAQQAKPVLRSAAMVTVVADREAGGWSSGTRNEAD